MARGPKVPASITLVLGPQSNAVNANPTMWAFFLAHPCPDRSGACATAC
jgi:hypothetical protein